VVPSTMSKSAVHAMTLSLAVEWGRHGIRLNCVGPGEIPTEGASKRLNPAGAPGARSALVNPMGRCGTMHELQNLVTFLLSDGCDWLSGQSIMLDGANHLANGGSFYEMRHWTDEQWADARARIKEQNARDKASRG
ncbi:MAG: SDR family oxidoreductase, partial [Steroidobacteraceae bacterium]